MGAVELPTRHDVAETYFPRKERDRACEWRSFLYAATRRPITSHRCWCMATASHIDSASLEPHKSRETPLGDGAAVAAEFAVNCRLGSPQGISCRNTLRTAYARHAGYFRVRTNDLRLSSPVNSRLRGRLNCFVSETLGWRKLPASPQKGDGFLRIHLVPDGVTWSSALPEHYLIADLQWSRPTSFKEGRIIDLPLGTNVEFVIYGGVQN